ncbi:L-histidine N(alpha)-methyltransferase [Granulicella sp. 5B5]|nr:L-histidine N(alpha)-methyltransferase [Granulicella sp. 5B5]
MNDAVLSAALTGFNVQGQKSLPPWLFYDDIGSALFEQITALPEYYLTRTERALFTTHAEEIVTALGADITLAELGAGSAAKTGILLRAAADAQPNVLYQPIDISPSALDEAAAGIALHIPGVTVVPQVANYITERYSIIRPPHHRVLALYIGSSIGNFSPSEARSILCNLRHHLAPGDALLLGTDLAPSAHKTVATLLAAYDDASGTTAAFNKNILHRLNRELAANFSLDSFAHRARWNASESRIEMHLESLIPQTVHIAGKSIDFAAQETIHTENSYKFTTAARTALLTDAHFTPTRTFTDPAHTFAVTLATAI